MSLGKNNFTLTKQENGNERFPVQGVRGINFAHIANDGETSIPFSSLVLPSSYAQSGFANPSGDFLLSLGLSAYRGNFIITSSLGYTIQKSEYVVTNSAINFKDYVASENEIFEVSVPGVVTGGQRIVDVRTYKIAGDLLNGTDEFDMGIEVDVNNFEFLVFREGQQLFQATNNDSSGTSGNFYILDPDGDGKGSTIKFFSSASAGDEPILVVSLGGVADSPSVSTFQEIDNLAGQIDAIVPTVAALADVPESTFRGAPARPNLLAFADRVLQIENTLDSFLNIDIRNYQNIQEYQIQENLSAIANKTNEFQWNLGSATITNSGFTLIAPEDDNANTRTIFRANRRVEVQIYFDCAFTVNDQPLITKNGVVTISGNACYGTNAYVQASGSLILEAGEFFTVGSGGNARTFASGGTPPTNAGLFATVTFIAKDLTTQKLGDLI